jgi:hypothetical protein
VKTATQNGDTLSISKLPLAESTVLIHSAGSYVFDFDHFITLLRMNRATFSVAAAAQVYLPTEKVVTCDTSFSTVWTAESGTAARNLMTSNGRNNKTVRTTTKAATARCDRYGQTHWTTSAVVQHYLIVFHYYILSSNIIILYSTLLWNCQQFHRTTTVGR